MPAPSTPWRRIWAAFIATPAWNGIRAVRNLAVSIAHSSAFSWVRSVCQHWVKLIAYSPVPPRSVAHSGRFELVALKIVAGL